MGDTNFVTIIDQLVRIYETEEPWHTTRMSHEEAVKYHQKLYDDGCIIVYHELGVVLGYIEVWRLSFEQLGRCVCRHPFSAYLEDVKSGNIAYVANVWVDEKFRRGSVMKMIKHLFFAAHHDAEYFVGEALRKKTQPVKAFKRDELRSEFVTKGV